MLLGIGDYPFPLFSATILICLGNRMAYSATHGLRESRIRFIVIIDCEKMLGERGPIVRDSNSRSIELLIIPMQLLLLGLRCLGLQYFQKGLVH
jgi:hypothetical protein